MRNRTDQVADRPNVSDMRDGKLVLHFDAILDVVLGDVVDAVDMLREEYEFMVMYEELTGPPAAIIITGLSIPEQARKAIQAFFDDLGTQVIWSHPFMTRGYGERSGPIAVLPGNPLPEPPAPQDPPIKRTVTPPDPDSDCPF